MVTVDNIKQILECSDMYAQKLLDGQTGKKSISRPNQSEAGRTSKREAVVEYGA